MIQAVKMALTTLKDNLMLLMESVSGEKHS